MKFIWTIFLFSSVAFGQLAVPLDPIKLAEETRQISDPALIQAVYSNSARDQIQAAVALGRIVQPAGVDLLLFLLQASPALQARALFALGQYGWKPDVVNGREAEIVNHIVPFLSRKGRLRLSALEAIGKLYLPAHQNLILPYLEHADAEVRLQALRSLFQHRLSAIARKQGATLLPFSEQSIARICTLLNGDKRSAVRINAAVLLGSLKTVHSLTALINAASDPDEMVRTFSLRALASLNGLREENRALILPVFQRAVRDTSYLVRTEAWISTARLNPLLKIGPGLLANLGKEFSAVKNDPNPHVRAVFVDALAGEPSMTLAEIDAFVRDPSPLVRERVVSAKVKVLNAQSLPVLLDAMKDPSWFVRAESSSWISVLPDDQKETLGLLGLRDPAPQVRSSFLVALFTVKTPNIQIEILKNLSAPSSAVRQAAVYAALEQEIPGAESSLFATYQNSQSKFYRDVRDLIIQYWVANKNNDTTNDLIEALKDPQPLFAYEAYKELRLRSVPNLPDMVQPKPEIYAGSFLRFKKNPVLKFSTTRGNFFMELFPHEAPIHVSRMVTAARRGVYDGLPWHRVENNFVVQGGDPDKTGWTSGDDPTRAEFNEIKSGRGTVAMPRSSDWDSGGTQLFITHVPTPHLDSLYTIFGQVTRGMDVIDYLQPGDVIKKVFVE